MRYAGPISRFLATPAPITRATATGRFSCGGNRTGGLVMGQGLSLRQDDSGIVPSPEPSTLVLAGLGLLPSSRSGSPTSQSQNCSRLEIDGCSKAARERFGSLSFGGAQIACSRTRTSCVNRRGWGPRGARRPTIASQPNRSGRGHQ